MGARARRRSSRSGSAYARAWRPRRRPRSAVAAGSLAILARLAEGLAARCPRRSSRSSPPRLAVAALGLPVETIGSRFGEIRAAIPAPAAARRCTLDRIRELFSPALTVALLAGDRIAAVGGRRRRHDRQPPQVQRRARRAGDRQHRLGAFGGMPATGAIARTATNVKNGGRTPVAGMTHALSCPSGPPLPRASGCG